MLKPGTRPILVISMSGSSSASKLLRITKLNASPTAYHPILKLQEMLFQERKKGEIADTWLMLEHSPTYTMGKRGSEKDFPKGLDEARRAGAAIHTIPRGGETTFHGPGQLVLYPIVDLRGLKLGARAFVEGLEDVMIDMAACYGIKAQGRLKCRTGVWVGEEKLGAIGVKISGGITCHGIAFNVAPDLSYFDRIIPCGQRGKGVTSVEKELGLGAGPSMKAISNLMASTAMSTFGYGGVEWLPDVDQLVKTRHITEE